MVMDMSKKIFTQTISWFFIGCCVWGLGALPVHAKTLRVVATLPDYAEFVKAIGGDRVSVEHIVHAVQNPHSVRPKPSFVHIVKQADVVISTGLDLELWLTTVIDKSANSRVRSGEIGFIAVSDGMPLLEKPQVISQSEGDVHVYGNPHFTCSPLCMRRVAGNIAIGLIKNDPDSKEFFQQNLKKLQDEIDKRLFGETLVKLLGGEILVRLAEQDKLIDFLKQNKLKGEPLINLLGGWMGKMMPLRGKKIVVFHTNWSYFTKLFGIDVVGTIEPKPGIPPSAKHVAGLIDMMKDKHIQIIFAANYFDQQKIKAIADRVDAEAIIVPLFVGGMPEADTYFKMIDIWTDRLIQAAKNKGLVAQK
jgi:zinc/manganese transport system substrate-binding protein